MTFKLYTQAMLDRTACSALKVIKKVTTIDKKSCIVLNIDLNAISHIPLTSSLSIISLKVNDSVIKITEFSATIFFFVGGVKVRRTLVDD
jgi:hypothetical protein